MVLKRLALLLVLGASAAGLSFAADCAPPTRRVSIDLWSTRSLSSPDRRWTFTSVGPKSAESVARLYIEDRNSRKKWDVGSIERDGTVFWSSDSRRIFLRDEYAADDTNIRLFDVTGQTPKEIEGLDNSIREAIFRHMSPDETTLWLYYPRVCFAAANSSIILLSADAPRVPITGSGSGKGLTVRLAVDATLLKVRELRVSKEP